MGSLCFSWWWDTFSDYLDYLFPIASLVCLPGYQPITINLNLVSFRFMFSYEDIERNETLNAGTFFTIIVGNSEKLNKGAIIDLCFCTLTTSSD